MPLTCHFRLATGVQLLQGVLADGLQHRVAQLVTNADRLAHQALVDQLTEQIEGARSLNAHRRRFVMTYTMVRMVP